MPTVTTLVRLLLALTVAFAACSAENPRKKGKSPMLASTKGKPSNSSISTDPTSNADELAGFPNSKSPDIPAFEIVASKANASEIDPDQGIRGPNCHRADTDGIIRFIVMVASLSETRALSYRFRLVEPNGEIVAAAGAAKANSGSVDSGSRSPGNDSKSGGGAFEFGNAAASLNLGNMSLQLLGMIEYSYSPSLYKYDMEGLYEYSRELVEALLNDLKKEVSEKLRPITCLLFRYPTGDSIIYKSWYLSPTLLSIVRTTLKASGFRAPGGSHLSSEMAMEMEYGEEIKQKWVAVNFLMGNFALDFADVDVGHRASRRPVKLNVSTNLVVDINDVSINALLEASVMHKTNYSLEEYSLQPFQFGYAGMGMRESVLHFAGFDFAHDRLDKNNKTVHKTYEVNCVASNLTFNYSYLDVTNVPMHGQGGDGAKCFDRVRALTGDKIAPENVPYDGDRTVYAVSGAYDLLKFLAKAGIGKVTHSTTVCPTTSFACDAYISSVEEIQSAAKTVCRNPPRKAGMELFYCINLVFLDRLLRDVPGLLPESTFIAIGPHPIYDWPLGLSVLYLEVSIKHAYDLFN